MTNKLFVGGISWDTNDEGLKTFFEQMGEVVEAKIIFDRFKNRSKGFGFVTFANEEDAAKAKEQLDGADLDGRNLRVDFAQPKAE